MFRIRFTYVVLFFAQWVACIVIRLVYLTLFGPQAAVRYSPRLIIYAFVSSMLLASSIVGPNLVELFRKTLAPGKRLSVDSLYLRLIAGRTSLVIIYLGIFAGTVLSDKHATDSSRSFAWAAVALGVFTCLRLYLLSVRVSAREFGATSYEARQLVRFVEFLFQSPETKPPGPLPPTPSGTPEPVRITSSARLAH